MLVAVRNGGRVRECVRLWVGGAEMPLLLSEANPVVLGEAEGVEVPQDSHCRRLTLLGILRRSQCGQEFECQHKQDYAKEALRSDLQEREQGELHLFGVEFSGRPPHPPLAHTTHQQRH